MAGMSEGDKQEMQSYIEAYKQEFLESEQAKNEQAAIDPNDDDLAGQIDKLVPDAVGVVKTILRHGHTEGVRATMARWLIDKKLDMMDKKDDPLTAFLNSMQEAANEAKAEQEAEVANDEANASES